MQSVASTSAQLAVRPTGQAVIYGFSCLDNARNTIQKIEEAWNE